eukprot:scaffold15185_cov107-Isochrysis_galbana.AAC.4
MGGRVGGGGATRNGWGSAPPRRPHGCPLPPRPCGCRRRSSCPSTPPSAHPRRAASACTPGTRRHETLEEKGREAHRSAHGQGRYVVGGSRRRQRRGVRAHW